MTLDAACSCFLRHAIPVAAAAVIAALGLMATGDRIMIVLGNLLCGFAIGVCIYDIAVGRALTESLRDPERAP